MAKLVSATYGDALYAAASEEGRTDEFYDAALTVTRLLNENQKFKEILSHPDIAKDEKIRVIEETFGSVIPDEMTGLMTLMVKKGRASSIASALSHFTDLVKQEKGIGRASVTSAAPLDKDQKKRVEEKILSTTDYKSLEMTYSVDPSLIGGMVIRVGDRVADGSVKTKLAGMTARLRG